MKRSWIGLILLLILLAGGILSTWAMDEIHTPIEEQLNQAAECVLLGDWENGDLLFLQAQGDWKRSQHFRACFADHTPVEEADAEFAQLEVYRLTREDAAFAAGCRALARKTAAIGEAHEMVWWNVL